MWTQGEVKSWCATVTRDDAEGKMEDERKGKGRKSGRSSARTVSHWENFSSARRGSNMSPARRVLLTVDMTP